jgi:hypothetical protein
MKRCILHSPFEFLTAVMSVKSGAGTRAGLERLGDMKAVLSIRAAASERPAAR